LLDPTNGTISYNPATGVTYTPNPGFSGQDRFVYKICTQYDTCDSAEVVVTVTPPTPAANPTPRRAGQVLGASEKINAPLPRTGGEASAAVNLLLAVSLLLSMGFFSSLYFIKTKTN
jgi:hypothetical protein